MTKRAIVTVATLLLLALSAGAELAPEEQKLIEAAQNGHSTTVKALESSVNIKSATENLEGVREMSDFYAELFERIGFETRWVPLPEDSGRAGHFIAELKGTKGPRILFIGHLDTVLEGEAYRVEENRAYGSGIADMKGGNIIIWAALEAMVSTGTLKDRQVVVIFTGDEESPGDPLEVVRHDLVELAQRSDIALAYEGAGNGTAVVGRRGITGWALEVDGQTGHSSGIFNERMGSGAIYEAARILTALHDQLKEPNLTYNASVIIGGTDVEFVPEENGGRASGKSNIVPQKVFAKGDLRFLTSEQHEGAKVKMREIVSAHLPKTDASIEFFEGYPPMAPTEGNRRVLAVYDQASQDLGYESVAEYDPGKRGAGDISFVAEYVDGLDGLGAFGSRSHAPGESIDLQKLMMQVERTALMTYRLTR